MLKTWIVGGVGEAKGAFVMAKRQGTHTHNINHKLRLC